MRSNKGNKATTATKADQATNKMILGGVPMVVRTIPVVQEEVSVIEAKIAAVTKEFTEGRIKHTAKVAQVNRYMVQIDNLMLEQTNIMQENAKAVASISTAARSAREQALDRSGGMVGTMSHDAAPIDRAFRNASVGAFQKHAIETATTRFRDLGEYQVTVIGIEWFAKPDRNNRLGRLVVQIPFGYAEIKYYDRNAAPENRMQWHEFTDYDLNQFKSSFNPPAGSGVLTLAIRQGAKDGQLYLSLPKSTSDKRPGEYFDKMRVRDIRFGKAISDNNRNLEAALTAYLRFFVNEFVQANPINRHGIEEHCGSCKFNMYVPGYDGTDNDPTGYKNTLNTNDTIEMVQWGQDIPRRFCMINRDLVDLEIVKDINEAAQKEVTHWFDEEGAIRWLKPGEVILNGRGIHRYQAIKQGTIERCGACPHYHNNSPKGEEKVAAELTKKREELGNPNATPFVSKYWSENGRTERMSIQTLVQNHRDYEWVNQYPGEVEAPIEFRVYGIGGTVVYGSEEVNMAAASSGVLSLIPMTEEVDKMELECAKTVNIIHQTCNRMAEVTPANLEAVFMMMQKKFDGASERMLKRLDGAKERLVRTLQELRDAGKQA